MVRALALCLIGVVALLGAGSPTLACGCYVQTYVSLRREYAQAKIVVYGSFSNPREGKPSDKTDAGSTDLVLDKTLKDHEALRKAQVITIPRYAPGMQGKYLVFIDLHEGKLDPFGAVPATAATLEYVKGALALDAKDRRSALPYFFKHLEHPDPTIAKDAFHELIKGRYAGDLVSYDYRDLVGRIQAGKLATWVQNPGIPIERRDMYAALLGHCGGETDATLLRRLLDDPQMTGVLRSVTLIGYIMLKPRDGWTYTLTVLGDPNKDFVTRYAALRAARFFREIRPSLINQKDLLAGVCLLLQQADIADLAVEDLRRWKRWEAADRVLALREQEGFDIPIIRRALLRYALQCPKPSARAFVQRLRQMDAEAVQEVEELLKIESEGLGVAVLRALLEPW